VIKSRIIKQARMEDVGGAYRFLMGNPEGKRPLGRHSLRWDENVKIYLQTVGLVVRTGLIWPRLPPAYRSL
jgi:hypothetical protein